MSNKRKIITETRLFFKKTNRAIEKEYEKLPVPNNVDTIVNDMIYEESKEYEENTNPLEYFQPIFSKINVYNLLLLFGGIIISYMVTINMLNSIDYITITNITKFFILGSILFGVLVYMFGLTIKQKSMTKKFKKEMFYDYILSLSKPEFESESEKYKIDINYYHTKIYDFYTKNNCEKDILIFNDLVKKYFDVERIPFDSEDIENKVKQLMETSEENINNVFKEEFFYFEDKMYAGLDIRGNLDTSNYLYTLEQTLPNTVYCHLNLFENYFDSELFNTISEEFNYVILNPLKDSETSHLVIYHVNHKEPYLQPEIFIDEKLYNDILNRLKENVITE